MVDSTPRLGSPGPLRDTARAMSQEHVEIVRRFLVTMVRGDYDAAVRDFDADAKWHNTGALPGPTTAEIGDTVVVGLHSRARGRGSGAPVDVRWGMSFRFERGSIIRADVYGEYDR